MKANLTRKILGGSIVSLTYLMALLELCFNSLFILEVCRQNGSEK